LRKNKLKKLFEVYNKYDSRTLFYKILRYSNENCGNLEAKKFQVSILRKFFDLKGWHINPFRAIKIDPKKIEYVQTGEPNTSQFDNNPKGRFHHEKPMILSSDWYRKTTSIKETKIYRGLKQRFEKNFSWNDTVLSPENYQLKHPNLRGKYARYDSNEFLRRGEHLDKLYNSLSERGYKNWMERNDSFFNELTLNIGPDGRLIRNSEGLHRLILARIIGFESIPARVLVVHPDFLKRKS